MTTPFLKWAGGKTKLVPLIREMMPAKYDTYMEPFLGGGALFFAIAPKHATLNDANRDLMDTYRMVRADVGEVIRLLKPLKYNKTDYYKIREARPRDFEAAARFIYLNKTCFNGLYRVNKDGGFNVPFGRYTNPTICDESALRACSEALHSTSLLSGDFESCMSSASRGDFIYCDPPYVPVSATSDFTSYTKDKFGPGEQERLRDVAWRAKERGVHVVLSNSDTPFVRKLYKDFKLRTITAARAINSKADRRGAVKELLIT